MLAASSKMKYRLSLQKKSEIATNLIACLSGGTPLTDDATLFLTAWFIKGNRREKRYTDVWDIVLDRYTPSTTPILYRACDKSRRIREGKVASYTTSFDNALKWKTDKIIVLDTMVAQNSLAQDEEFNFSFFPLWELIKEDRDFNEMVPEYEYIVRETYAGSKIFRLVYP